jgi:hypothetical protein
MIFPLTQDRSPTRLSQSQQTTSEVLSAQTRITDASSVPTLRQTTQGVEALLEAPRVSPQFSGLSLGQIRSSRQAPSSIVTEQFLASRISLSPAYIENMAASRAERISNLYADAPRFRNQIDILA